MYSLIQNIGGELICLLWFVIYLLLIKRGFQDKSFGMPAVALCTNVAWEFLIAFILPPPCKMFQLASIVWLLADLGILATCIKFRRTEFHHFCALKPFVPLTCICIFASGHIQLLLIDALQDHHGIIVAQFNNFLLSAMLVAMILQRQSVRGQSLYIASLVCLANLIGWASYGHGGCMSPEDYPDNGDLIIALFKHITALNIIYIGLVTYYSIKNKINPFFRL